MIPPISPILFNGFARYSRWYLGRNFNAVRISRSGPAPEVHSGRPLLIYLNHPAWWDPLICLLLAKTYWPTRRHYAPIDQDALDRYPMLDRLGFFGVKKRTRRGSVEFLKTGGAILAEPGAALWVTAEGEFTDPRDGQRPLLPGISHLLKNNAHPAVIPLAIEYPFWQERRPEALCSFGQAAGAETLDSSLRAVQQQLAVSSIGRDAAQFQTLLAGAGGIGWVYDGWRRVRAFVRRRKFAARHEDLA